MGKTWRNAFATTELLPVNSFSVLTNPLANTIAPMTKMNILQQLTHSSTEFIYFEMIFDTRRRKLHLLLPVINIVFDSFYLFT